MTLYHSTPRKNVESILREGLRPNGMGIVYLSEKPDSWWRGNAVLSVCLDGLWLRLTTFNDQKLDEVLCWGRIPPSAITIYSIPKMKNERQGKMDGQGNECDCDHCVVGDKKCSLGVAHEHIELLKKRLNAVIMVALDAKKDGFRRFYPNDALDWFDKIMDAAKGDSKKVVEVVCTDNALIDRLSAQLIEIEGVAKRNLAIAAKYKNRCGLIAGECTKDMWDDNKDQSVELNTCVKLHNTTLSDYRRIVEGNGVNGLADYGYFLGVEPYDVERKYSHCENCFSNFDEGERVYLVAKDSSQNSIAKRKRICKHCFESLKAARDDGKKGGRS